MNEIKNCIGCQKPVRGRTDKKFCTEHCRNNYHNQLNAAENNLMRNINHVLSKNRKIMQEIMGNNLSVAKVSKEQLLMNGFQWRYFTHQQVNNKGNTFTYCYDFGYRIINEQQAVLIRDTLKKNKLSAEVNINLMES